LDGGSEERPASEGVPYKIERKIAKYFGEVLIYLDIEWEQAYL